MKILRARSVVLALAVVAAGLGVAAPTVSAATQVGEFHSLSPARLLDTRTSNGGHLGKVGQGETMTLTVLGRGGVPATNVDSVVLNVTADAPNANSFVSVFPTGGALPSVSNLNTVPGVTVPNLVTVKVGTGGKVSLFNNAGTVHLIVDVAGWYGTLAAPNGGNYGLLEPDRLFDSREHDAPLVGEDYLEIGMPAGTTAVQFNITVTNAWSDGYLTVWNDGAPRPLASNLNFKAGQTVSNAVIVGYATSGRVRFYTNAAAVDIIVDAVGGFVTAPVDFPDATIRTVAPFRLLDSRSNGGVLGAGEIRSVQVAGTHGIPLGAQAVIVNVTATGTTAASYFTAYAADQPRPGVATVNWSPGQTVPNFAVIPLSSSGAIKVFNNGGNAHLLLDVVGWYM